ncbi:MAG: hypothetical protein AAGJ35_04420, partial [Myxococcota bacterium]
GHTRAPAQHQWMSIPCRQLALMQKGKLVLESKIVVPTPTEKTWNFALLGGAMLSPKANTQLFGGGTLALFSKYAGFRLGLWGTSKAFPQSPAASHLLLDLRGDLYVPWHWRYVHLHLGGYLGVGILRAYVQHPILAPRWSTLFHAGLTARLLLFGAANIGFLLQMDVGGVVFQAENLRIQPETNLSVGVFFRF